VRCGGSRTAFCSAVEGRCTVLLATRPSASEFRAGFGCAQSLSEQRCCVNANGFVLFFFVACWTVSLSWSIRSSKEVFFELMNSLNLIMRIIRLRSKKVAFLKFFHEAENSYKIVTKQFEVYNCSGRRALGGA
jgi:hypothetical protein